MEFKIGQNELRYVAGALAELGEMIISPSGNSIIAFDYSHTRRIAYTPPDGEVGTGRDVAVDAATISKVAKRVRGEARVSVGREHLVLETDSTDYKLRLMVAASSLGEPKMSGTGEVSMQAADLHATLEDVRAAGVDVVVIAADKGEALFSGEGASDCWITAPDATATGIGYSKLDLGLLLPCIPKMKDCMATITLSPKGPTAIRFGDNILFHQGGHL